MLTLIGKNLGERQKELNSKVAEAADNKSNFDEIQSQQEHSDADKLFKIDLASKYKNIHYILDVLKCGDSLYITRALRCLWIYDDEYSSFISPEYCHNKIFPDMSTKMKKQMLTTISSYVRNEDRAISFYKYCIQEKIPEYAFKFLIYTSDSFKMDLMKCSDNFDMFRDSKYLKHFVGNSFKLAQAYINMRGTSVLHELRYLYMVSSEQYLNLIERYAVRSRRYPNSTKLLGLRVSKDILKRHKARILKDPVLYINKLNKNMLRKYLTSDDVKDMAVSLLPDECYEFWSMNFYDVYKFILSLIPRNEIYPYLKQIFTAQYKGKPFEMDKRFYDLKYYEILNAEEREEWALRHIEREEELFGSGNDYIWYKFVSFEKAFTGIKRYIYLTPDKDRRSQIVNILTETVRNLDDMTKLLNYYYGRHVNENEHHKDSFICKVFAEHDIFAFSSECWTSLDKLLYSLDVYTVGFYGREDYKMKSLIYYILHGKELPEALQQFISISTRFYHTSDIENLSKERADIVSKYLINYYTEKIITLKEKAEAAEEEKKKSMNDKDVNDEEKVIDEFGIDPIQEEILNQVNNVWNVIYSFKRDKSECPEIVMKYMEDNWDFYQYHEAFKPTFEPKTEGDFVRWLKQDKDMVIRGIEDIRCNTYRWKFRLSRLFRKLRVYFSEDVAKEYLEYFTEYLSDTHQISCREYRNIKMAVAGVFYLADENFKVAFIEKYVPTAPKIDHMNIDRRLLQTQKAICRLAYCSRPPIPLANILKYIKGDYVHFILTLFNHYLVRQPMPLSIKFTETILDAPLSVQKHGLRLAFECFSSGNLINLITDVWRKTHNVSLRMLLYETLFYRIIKENEENQQALYDVLKHYTTQLHQDDQQDVFNLLVSTDLPEKFQGEFLELAWLTVSKLPEKSVNLERQVSVIRHMEQNIHLVGREFPRVNIIDDHIDEMLFDNDRRSDYDIHGLEQLFEAKWDLTARYIVSFKCQEEMDRSLQLLTIIINQCLRSWWEQRSDEYVIRQFTHKFINTIKEKAPVKRHLCGYAVPIYQCILDLLRISRPLKEMYLLIWDLKLSIAARKIIHKGTKRDTGKSKDNIEAEEIAKYFTNKVVKLVYELLERQEFLHSFYQPMAEILSDVCRTIGNIVNVDSEGICIYVCDSLADFKINETHILGLMILPTDPPYYWKSEHRSAIAKLQEFDNEESRCFMYKKFVSSNFEVRKYYQA